MLVASLEKNNPALLRRGRQPLVGYVSLRNTLAVTELHDRTRVEIDLKTRALVAAAAVLFGPALGLLFLLAPQRFTRMPLYIQGVVAATVVGMTFLLFRTLLRRPRFEVHRSGAIVVRDPAMTISGQAVRGVSIETDMYSDSGQRVFVPNSVLVLRTLDGEVRLCASPDSKLIETLALRVAALTRTNLTHK